MSAWHRRSAQAQRNTEAVMRMRQEDEQGWVRHHGPRPTAEPQRSPEPTLTPNDKPFWEPRQTQPTAEVEHIFKEWLEKHPHLNIRSNGEKIAQWVEDNCAGFYSEKNLTAAAAALVGQLSRLRKMTPEMIDVRDEVIPLGMLSVHCSKWELEKATLAQVKDYLPRRRAYEQLLADREKANHKV